MEIRQPQDKCGARFHHQVNKSCIFVRREVCIHAKLSSGHHMRTSVKPIQLLCLQLKV